jgi:hypothetical protein
MNGSMRPAQSTPNQDTSDTPAITLSANGVSSPAGIAAAPAVGGLEDDRVDAGDQEERHFQPPRVVAEIRRRLRDHEDRAGQQVEREADQGPRHEVPDDADRHSLHETEEAQVEHPDDTKQQREAREMKRLAERPQPADLMLQS